MHVIRDINSRYWQEGTGFQTLILLYTGYWPLANNETNRFLKFVRCIPYFIVGSTTATACIALYDLTFKLNDYILLAESLTYIIFLTKVIFVSIIGIVMMEDGVKVFALFNEFTRFIVEENDKHIINQVQRKSFWLTIIYVFAFTSYDLVFAIIPLFESERRFPMHYNLPLESPMYEIFYAGAIASGLSSNLVVSIFDSIIITAFLGFTGYLKVLQYKLEHSRAICLKKLTEELTPTQATGLQVGLVLASNCLIERNTNNTIVGDSEADSNQDQFEMVPISGLPTMDVQHDARISLVSDADLENHVIYIESLEQVDVKVPAKMSEESDEAIETVMDRHLAWRNMFVRIKSQVKRGQEGIIDGLSTVNDQRDVISLISDGNIESHVIDILSTENINAAADQEADEESTTDDVEHNVDNRALEVAMRRHLVVCVKMHQGLIWAINETQDKINYVLFLYLVLGSVSISLTMFLMTAVPFGSVEMILWSIYVYFILAVLYTYCWASSELKQQSVQVSDALYFSDWTETSPSYKRSMLIMMSRAVRPLEISTMNFLTFDMEMFTNVVNSAYSYFNVMSTMHKTK